MSEAIIKLEEIKKDYYMGSQAITVLKRYYARYFQKRICSPHGSVG
jgi:hypothetical protein